MVYHNIDLDNLVLELTQNDDLNINLDNLDYDTKIQFKILITKLLATDTDTLELSNIDFNKIFTSVHNFGKIIKWDIPSKRVDFLSDKYSTWIINRENTQTKLFRLLLLKTKNGYKFADGFAKSTYKILIPEHLKIKYRDTNFTTFIDKTKIIEPINADLETSICLDKKYLMEYFGIQTKFYNRPIIELENDIYFANKTTNKILSETADFFKAKINFYEYINSRKKYYKVNYKRADSGRYYTFISTLNKNIRKHILYGFTEYDLENASVNYLYQVYIQIKTTDLPNLDLIKYYIENKTEFRNKVAQTITTNSIFNDDDLADSKAILTSLFFGSRAIRPKIFLDRENKHLKNAILDILKTKERQENFYSELYIEKFIAQVKILMATISTHLKDNYFDIKNCILKINNQKYYFRKKRKLNKNEKLEVKNIDFKLNAKPTRAIKRKLVQELDKLLYSRKYSPNSAVAFLYQSWESDFLTNQIALLKDKKKIQGNKDFFLLHDAIYLKNGIDKSLFLETKQTGNFKVEVKI